MKSLILLCLVPFMLQPALAQTAPTILSLPDAITLALKNHPALKVFPLREQRLQAEGQSQSLTPPVALNLELENFAGGGNYRGVDNAEITLALSSVVELGGKREARQALAGAQVNQLEAERQALALDLLGEVTRRFVELVGAQEVQTLARDGAQLAEQALASVRQRAQIGAAADADVARAQAAVAQAHLTLAASKAARQSARLRLAASWGDTHPTFNQVTGNLYDLGEADDFATLYERVSQHPSIQALAAESRLREAEWRLSQSQSSLDISWTGGVRYLRDSGDAALVAGVSIPLATGQRNRSALRAARLAQDEVALTRNTQMLQLHDQLYAAFEQRQQALNLAIGLQQNVLPLLEKALAETRSAWERGRYSYLEFVGARNELINARRALIEAATTAQRARADIEQLIGQPLQAARLSSAE